MEKEFLRLAEREKEEEKNKQSRDSSLIITCD